MLPRKAVERIIEREKKHVRKKIDKKIASLQKQIKMEKQMKHFNWWWVESWKSAIKILEEIKKEI